MMDKLFRLTQERNKALEDRLAAIEQDSVNWTIKKVQEFEKRIQSCELSLKYPDNNLRLTERGENTLNDRSLLQTMTPNAAARPKSQLQEPSLYDANYSSLPVLNNLHKINQNKLVPKTRFQM